MTSRRAEHARQAVEQRRWTHRHPGWTRLGVAFGVFLAIAIGIRAIAPWVIAWAIERSAPEYLAGRVEIGDIDLGLLEGSITVQDVSAYGPNPASEEATEEESPWFHLAEARVRIAWRPLRYRMIWIRELALVDPFLALARTANGELDLRTRLRVREPEPDDTGSGAGAGWQVAVDDGSIRGGRVRFRDFAVGAQERLRLDLEAVEAQRFSLAPGSFDRPARLDVRGTIASAPFALAATLTAQEDGARQITGTLSARQIPLSRAQAYVAELGRFADLAGKADLDVAFERVPGERQTVSGSASIFDFELHTEGLARPALAWRSLSVVADSIDLDARRAVLQSVRLIGPRAVMRVGPEPSIPVLAAVEETGARDAATDMAAVATEQPTAPAWTWSIGSAALEDGAVQLREGDWSVDVGLDATAEQVRPDGRFPVYVALRSGKGSAALDAQAALAPPGVTGTLALASIRLPRFARAAGLELPALRSATLGGTLDVDYETEPAGDPSVRSMLSLAGEVQLTDVLYAAEDPEAFSFGFDRLEGSVTGARIPLPAAAGTPEIEIAELVLSGAVSKLRRSDSGFVLPGRDAEPVETSAAAPDPAASEIGVAAEATSGAGTTGGEAATSPPEGAGAEPAVRISIGALRIEDGRISVEDRTVEPFYRQQLTVVEAKAENVRWPDLHADPLRIVIEGLGAKPAVVTGSIRDGNAELEAEGVRIALEPLNPYVTSHSDYAIQRGALSFDAKLDLDLDPREYAAKLGLRLHDLGIQATDHAFRRDFGVSLALGLALLRDVRGDIVLAIPIEGGAEGARVGTFATIRNAIARAILNALTTPLKVIGAVVRRGGEVKSFEPAPISFEAGSATITGAGRERLERLATLLASKPALAVVLQPVVVAGEPIAGSPGSMGTAAEGDSRPEADADTGEERAGIFDRIRGWFGGGSEEEVAQRRVDAPSAAEETQDEAAATEPQSPVALAQARLDVVRRHLVEQFGVPAQRIEARVDPQHVSTGPPRIDVALQPAG